MARQGRATQKGSAEWSDELTHSLAHLLSPSQQWRLEFKRKRNGEKWAEKKRAREEMAGGWGWRCGWRTTTASAAEATFSHFPRQKRPFDDIHLILMRNSLTIIPILLSFAAFFYASLGDFFSRWLLQLIIAELHSYFIRMFLVI